MRGAAVRLGPALLAAVAAVAALAAVPAGPGVEGRRREVPSPPAQSVEAAAPGAEGRGEACWLLADLSWQAAALTGSLALVDVADRPAGAGEAARQIRSLAAEASRVEGGDELAETLAGLAEALGGYARGEPAALAGVSEASASNARLRSLYEGCWAVARAQSLSGQPSLVARWR